MKLMLAVLVETDDLDKIRYHVAANSVFEMEYHHSELLPPGETRPTTADDPMIGRIVGAQKMEL